MSSFNDYRNKKKIDRTIFVIHLKVTPTIIYWKRMINQKHRHKIARKTYHRSNEISIT